MTLRVRGKKLDTIMIGILIHVVIFWIALALGYNSYKEYSRNFMEPLGVELKDAIKATFPTALFTFPGLYFASSVLERAGGIFLGKRMYLYMIVSEALLLNVYYYQKGIDVLIPVNLSIMYFIVLLAVSVGMVKLVNSNLDSFEEMIRPFMIRLGVNIRIKSLQENLKKNFSYAFIIAFAYALSAGAFLVLIGEEKFSEVLSEFALFALLIAMLIEAFKLIKFGEKDVE